MILAAWDKKINQTEHYLDINQDQQIKPYFLKFYLIFLWISSEIEKW